MKELLLIVLLSLTQAVKASISYTDIPDYNLEYGDFKTISFGLASVTFYGDGITNLMPDLTMSSYMEVSRITGGTAPAKAISSGTSIGSSMYWSGQSLCRINDFSFPNEFPSGSDRFVGVRFQSGGSWHYGWIRVQYSPSVLIIKSYAYETTGDLPISAGAISSGGGGGGGGGSTQQWILLNAENDQIYPYVGDSVQVYATLMPDNIPASSYTWSIVNIVGTATISSTGMLTALTPGLVRVKATSSISTINEGNLYFDIQGFAALDEMESILKVFPNPCRNDVRLVFPNAAERRYSLFTMEGQGVLSGTVYGSEASLSVEALESGCYVLQMDAGGFTERCLLIKE